MSSALRSSVIEIVMLVLCIAWIVIFSATLLRPDKGADVRQVAAATVPALVQRS